MTVAYSSVVATRTYSTFLRLLFMWKGSVYRLIWFELLIFSSFYGVLSVVYRFLLEEKSKRFTDTVAFYLIAFANACLKIYSIFKQSFFFMYPQPLTLLLRYFEYACIYCSEYYELIPVPFVLGFYVSLVVGRWWDQFLVLPWPDQLALYLTAFCDGNDEPAIRIRRTVVRYANLSYCLALRAISSRARLRFPTEEHLVLAGLMTSEELEMYANTPPVEYTLYFAPLVWAMDIVNKARKEGHIQSDHAVEVLTAEITSFRGKLGTIFAYDWVNPPLVYTQTATIVVYSYCAAALLAWQHLDPNREYANHKIDIYVPIFGLLRFFFYIGWLKVAESLINPFGEDVDDFEIEYLIERNLNISYLIVDGMHREHPDLVRDAFWDSVNVTLPKRPESAGHGETATTQVDDDEREKIVSASRLTGSLANLDLPERRPSLALWNRTTVSRVPSNSSHREN